MEGGSDTGCLWGQTPSQPHSQVASQAGGAAALPAPVLPPLSRGRHPRLSHPSPARCRCKWECVAFLPLPLQKTCGRHLELSLCSRTRGQTGRQGRTHRWLGARGVLLATSQKLRQGLEISPAARRALALVADPGSLRGCSHLLSTPQHPRHPVCAGRGLAVFSCSSPASGKQVLTPPAGGWGGLCQHLAPR